jgi:curved DNA-binding protein CbpA
LIKQKNCAMNYYEELGITVTAGEEEIRKAHRRLVKLMHPDQQRDQSLKLLAETQMRRLNSVVATLLDPEQRREYDNQLHGRPAARPAFPIAWRLAPWWIASTIGAVVLTVGAVWFWADHLGSLGTNTPVYIPPDDKVSWSQPPAPMPNPGGVPSDNTRARLTQTQPPPPAASARANKGPENEPPATGLQARVLSSPPEPSRPAEAHEPAKSAADLNKARRPEALSKQAPPAEPEVAVSGTHKTFSLPSDGQLSSSRPKTVDRGQTLTRPGLNPSPTSADDSGQLPLPALPPAAPPKTEAAKAAAPPAKSASQAPATGEELASLRGPANPLEGEWVYAPKEPEKHKPGFYPPEFISLKLVKDDRSLRGQYSARYDVAAKEPISPEVRFQLTSVDKAAHKFVWQSSNGSKGTLAIRPLDGKTIRLEWRTTVLNGGPALTSGIATLVRRQ